MIIIIPEKKEIPQGRVDVWDAAFISGYNTTIDKIIELNKANVQPKQTITTRDGRVLTLKDDGYRITYSDGELNDVLFAEYKFCDDGVAAEAIVDFLMNKPKRVPMSDADILELFAKSMNVSASGSLLHDNLDEKLIDKIIINFAKNIEQHHEVTI